MKFSDRVAFKKFPTKGILFLYLRFFIGVSAMFKMTVEKEINQPGSSKCVIKFTGCAEAINQIYNHFSELQKRLNKGILPTWTKKETATMNGNSNNGKEISYKN